MMVVPGIFGDSCSSASSALLAGGSAATTSSSSNKPAAEKLLQVDIYPLGSPPPPFVAVENDSVDADADDNGNNPPRHSTEEDDDMDRLAHQFGTNSMLTMEVPLCNDHSPSRRRTTADNHRHRVRIDRYRDSAQLSDIMRLIGRELSEPYSIYTYLYFIHQWPELCVLAIDCDNEAIVGAILCKLDRNALDERNYILSRGYIGMLAVEESYRGHGIGTRLIQTVVELSRQQGCHEVVLETEVSNARSLSLYGRLGFIRDGRLFRYYLNGDDAFRLKLFLEPPPSQHSSSRVCDDGHDDDDDGDVRNGPMMMMMKQQQQASHSVDTVPGGVFDDRRLFDECSAPAGGSGGAAAGADESHRYLSSNGAWFPPTQ